MKMSTKPSPEGSYYTLAAFMAQYPDTAIFRTFSKLNKRNLLYLQAEIAVLEDQLHDVAEEDREDSSRREYGADWRSLASEYLKNEEESRIARTNNEEYKPQHSRDGLQWEIFLKIRSLLEKYSE
jgi:hypothetical protein